MLVYDGIYRWEGFGGRLRLPRGCCRLRIWDLGRRGFPGAAAPLRPILVLVADLPESPLSVRSCAGHVATGVAREFALDPQRMLFVEHVPARRYGRDPERVIPEEFLAVEFTWTEGGAIQPRWRTLPPPLADAVRRLAGSAEEPGGAGP